MRRSSRRGRLAGTLMWQVPPSRAPLPKGGLELAGKLEPLREPRRQAIGRAGGALTWVPDRRQWMVGGVEGSRMSVQALCSNGWRAWALLYLVPAVT